MFISNDKCNVQGLVLAGSADFKTELHQSDMFDLRLQEKVITTVDVSYGGENGFNQAIELSAEKLGDVKFIQEKKLICKFFDEISLDSGQYCFGVDETMKVRCVLDIIAKSRLLLLCTFPSLQRVNLEASACVKVFLNSGRRLP